MQLTSIFSPLAIMQLLTHLHNEIIRKSDSSFTKEASLMKHSNGDDDNNVFLVS